METKPVTTSIKFVKFCVDCEKVHDINDECLCQNQYLETAN